MKPAPLRTVNDNAELREQASLEAGLKCEDESLTQQHFTEDADLNVIARRFGLDGQQLPIQALDPRMFRDTSNDPDLRHALETVRAATEHFNNLPARLRARFRNSPAEMWDFINDRENADEAVRLGLLVDPTKQTEVVKTTQKVGDPPKDPAKPGETPKPPEQTPKS